MLKSLPEKAKGKRGCVPLLLQLSLEGIHLLNVDSVLCVRVAMLIWFFTLNIKRKRKMKLNKKEMLFLTWLIAGLVIYGRMEQAFHAEEIEWKRNLKENIENDEL